MASGWNKPLNHRWDFDTNTLASELKKPPTPYLTGALWRSFRPGNKGTFGINKNAKGDGVTIRSEIVYARIHDRGGTIHFKTRSGSITIRKKDYVRAAVDRWAGNPRSIKARWGRVGERS